MSMYASPSTNGRKKLIKPSEQITPSERVEVLPVLKSHAKFILKGEKRAVDQPFRRRRRYCPVPVT
jgi:hypothetical protein